MASLDTPTLDRLKAFSKNANKDNPYHPSDTKMWNDFIIAAHRNDENFFSDDLEDWLKANGWSDDVASKLASEYGRMRSLLARI